MLRLVEDTGAPWVVSRFPTPVGCLLVVHTTPEVVVWALFTDDRSPAGLSRELGRSLPEVPGPPWLRQLVGDALAGTLVRPWSLMNPGLTPLEARALAAAVTVPFGTITSYGTVARLMGAPGRARLVGRAMSRSPAALFIPTHRVVHADGRPAPSEAGGIAERLRTYERHRCGHATPVWWSPP